MAKELESKVIEINEVQVEKKLIKIGAVLEFYNQTFTAIWMKNSRGKKFRIRQEGDKIKVEHKKTKRSKSEVKEAEETPLNPTDSLNDTINFFQVIGFKEISKSIKTRTAYILSFGNDEEKAEIVIDKYSDLDGMEIPPLLEIEATSRKTILKVARLLGFKESDLKNWGAKELVEHYKRIQFLEELVDIISTPEFHKKVGNRIKEENERFIQEELDRILALDEERINGEYFNI